MKTFTILFISLFGLGALNNTTKAQVSFSASVSFNSFYNQLSPYGQWLDVPRFGRVWRYTEPGFRPYATNGQWQYTDEGWYWNSDYAWGSIPFHYGRWELDPYYGWIWIPGYDYAPAWVAWSQADDCYGWAPLGFGADINISFNSIPSNRWMYAAAGNIMRPGIDRYCIPSRRNDYYFRRQQPVINIYTQRNVRYIAGPQWNDRFGSRNNRFDNRFDQQRPPTRNNDWGRYNNNQQPRGYNPGNSNNQPRWDNNAGNNNRQPRGYNPGNNNNQPRWDNNAGNNNRQPGWNNNRGNDRNPDNIHLDRSRVNRERAIASDRPQRNEGARPFGARDKRIF